MNFLPKSRAIYFDLCHSYDEWTKAL